MKHAERSSKTRDRSKSGMLAMNRNSEFRTMQRRRIKEAKENAGTN